MSRLRARILIGALTTCTTGAFAVAVPIASPAHGQAATAPPPVRVPAAADAAKLKQAEKMLDALGLEQQYDVIFAKMIPVMTMQLFGGIENNAEVPAKLRQALKDEARGGKARRSFATRVQQGFRARYPILRARTASEYAAVFSLDELADLEKFYAGPLGQKSLRVMPTLQNRLFDIGAGLGAEVGKEALVATLNEMQQGQDRPAT